jgi:hypothetical protein
MTDDSKEKIGIETEKLRMHQAFWLSIFGMGLAAALTVFLVASEGTQVNTSAEVVAIVGLFTSVTGTLVGAFFGLQIGQAGAEHERRNRRMAEERGQKTEDALRRALPHVPAEKVKEVLNPSQEPSPN